MTPMIDMVFLLLVFFMCVSSLAQSEKRIPVALPEAAESEVPENRTGRLTLTVLADGTVYAGGVGLEPEALAERIRGETARNPRLKVEVRAERETAFLRIRRVLQACAEGGAYSVAYATYQDTRP